MQLINQLSQAFNVEKDLHTALPMAAYMKYKFSFHGIKKPLRAVIQKKFFKDYPVTSEAELITLLELLWDKSEREYQYVACDLAYTYKKLWTPTIFAHFEKFIRTKSWWDTVDTLASKMVGTLINRYPELQNAMDSWIDDDNLWIRRTALIHQLRYKEKTDKERLFRYCLKTMDEQEFFIRKALGWSLRQYAKTNPEAVKDFITEHKEQLSPLSYKEAAKHLLLF